MLLEMKNARKKALLMYEQSASGQWSPKNNISVYYLQKQARAKQALHLTLRMILKTTLIFNVSLNDSLQTENHPQYDSQ